MLPAAQQHQLQVQQQQLQHHLLHQYLLTSLAGLLLLLQPHLLLPLLVSVVALQAVVRA
jgi:hypothetical protein